MRKPVTVHGSSSPAMRASERRGGPKPRRDQIENEDGAAEEGESEKMDDLGDANAGHRTAYGGVEPGILDPLH